MKILIIKYMNIGDVLLITPLIENLKLYYPNSEIDVAVIKGTEDMVIDNPYINRIFVYDRVGMKKLSLLKRLKEEISYINNIRKREYDIIIQTTRGDRGLITAILSSPDTIIAYTSKKKRFIDRFIDKAMPHLAHRHMVDTNLDAIRLLGYEPKSKRVSIYWNSEVDKNIDNILDTYNIKDKEFIHIHPVSRWMFKCIDDRVMAQIIDYIYEKYKLKVILTSAPVEKELQKIKSIISLSKFSPIDLSGKLTLKETASLNSRSKIFIGVDTAIMHISASNDIPTIGLFGPSAVYHWGPWDNSIENSGYRAEKGIQRMGKHIALQFDWDCIPCVKDGCNGTKISDCLVKMPFTFIQNYIDDMMNNRGNI